MDAETREAGEGPRVQCSTSERYILNCKGFINIRIIIINPQSFPSKWVIERIKGSSKKITSTFCRKGSNVMPLSRLSTKEGIVPATISSAPMRRKPSGTSWLIVVWGLRLLTWRVHSAIFDAVNCLKLSQPVSSVSVFLFFFSSSLSNPWQSKLFLLHLSVMEAGFHAVPVTVPLLCTPLGVSSCSLGFNTHRLKTF